METAASIKTANTPSANRWRHAAETASGRSEFPYGSIAWRDTLCDADIGRRSSGRRGWMAQCGEISTADEVRCGKRVRERGGVARFNDRPAADVLRAIRLVEEGGK